MEAYEAVLINEPGLKKRKERRPNNAQDEKRAHNPGLRSNGAGPTTTFVR